MRFSLLTILILGMIGMIVPSASAATYQWNEKTLDWISIEIESFRVIEKDHYNRIIINSVTDGKNIPINAKLELEIDNVRLTNPDGQIYYYDEDECIEEFGRSTVFTPAFYRLKIDYKEPIQNFSSCFAVKKYHDEFSVSFWSNIEIGSINIKENTVNGNSNPVSVPIEKIENLQNIGGGCLIATAAFGSEMAPQVQLLRELRDNTVLQTTSGTTFMNGFSQLYYSFSPYVADYERKNPVFKEIVKVTLTPLLTSLTLLNYVEINTDEEMLGYGIGIILLNIGMYFVAPGVLIIYLKKQFQKPKESMPTR